MSFVMCAQRLLSLLGALTNRSLNSNFSIFSTSIQSKIEVLSFTLIFIVVLIPLEFST